MSKTLKIGDVYKDFEVIDIFELKDYGSVAFYLRHKILGLEILHLFNDDEENLFSFSFRTPNQKSNGAAHIMEHSVLCGSEKYPLKDPFTQLSNQSVKTYLNACTYPDKTVYPASSIVRADYFNLMSVYADAVFFPRLSREIFMQEAYRLECNADGKYSIQGVVYNEMKGSYSSFDSVAYDVASRALYKNCVYEKDSGGDPLEIPTLSYEQYLEFHKKWYRPDNCFVFLNGNIPTCEQIDFLDENFIGRLKAKYPDCACDEKSRRQQIKNFIDYVNPAPLCEPVFLEEIGPAGDTAEKGSSVLVSFDLGHSKNALSSMEKVFLLGILLNHDGSPLQKALLDSGLGEDTAPGTGIESLYHVIFSAGLRGVKKSDVHKVKELIFKTFEQIVEKGIRKEDIDSTLMGLEFTHREIRRSSGPYALSIMSSPINAWLYGEKIQESFRLRAVLEKIRSKISGQKGYFESLIKKYFLENKNWAISVITPSKKYNSQRDKAEQKIIQNLLKCTTEEKIKQDNLRLKEFQSQKDSLSLLPHLHPADFLEEGKNVLQKIPINIEKLDVKGKKIDFLSTAQYTNGISYIKIGFPTDVLEPKDYKMLPLLSAAVTECGWNGLDWAKTAELTALHTGGISANLLVNSLSTTKKSREFAKQHDFCGREWLVFKLRVIDEKLSEGLKLLSDNIRTVDFSDLKRLKDILIELRNDVDSYVVPEGHQFALLRAQRKNSRVAAVDEIWNGITLLYNLHDFAKKPIDVLSSELKRIFSKLKSGGAFIHITAEKETIQKNMSLFKKFSEETLITPLIPRLNSSPDDFIKMTDLEADSDKNHKNSDSPEILIVPAQVGFSAQSSKANEYGTKMCAYADVCTHWLSNILLWEEIRTKCGAYGAFCHTESLAGTLLFATYRDPTPSKSNSVFAKCLKKAGNIDFTKEETEKAVVGTYSAFVQPKTPASKGTLSLIRTLYAVQDDEREQIIRNILAAKPSDLKKTFQKLYLNMQNGKYSVIICGKDLAPVGKNLVLPL